LNLLSHRQAVPAWKGYKPYDQFPLAADFGRGEWHESFVNDAGDAPDKRFFDFLKPLMAGGESVVVFDAVRFQELLQRMAHRHNNMRDTIEAFAVHIIDLQEVFSQVLYYNPQAGQDFSLLQLSKILFGNSQLTNLPFSSDALATDKYLKADKPLPEVLRQTLAAYSHGLQIMTEAFYYYLKQKF
jgi:hypothetical protein